MCPENRVTYVSGRTARASRELRMAGHPTQFTGGAPQTQARASRAKDGVPRSGAAAKVDCIGSSKSPACQYPRTSRARADTSNRNTLSRLRTPTQFPAGFRRARTCTRPPHDRTEALRVHPQQHLRSDSVLHRHHLERPSAAARTQPRRLPAHAALDTLASDRRRRVRGREARVGVRAIPEVRIGLRVGGASLQVTATRRESSQHATIGQVRLGQEWTRGPLHVA
jgi:hypothetical protein